MTGRIMLYENNQCSIVTHKKTGYNIYYYVLK